MVRKWSVRIVVCLCLGAFSSPVSAQSSLFHTIEFSGLVDTYYTYNVNRPPVGTMTPFRNFDVRHNQFSVALLELALDKPVATDDRIGFRFDLQYGQVAQIFNADPQDTNALVHAQQVYLRYLAPMGKGVTVDVGKFVTPIGYEPTEAHLNQNYSRSFWYALGPYYHVGVRASYPVTETLTVAGMLVNGWNQTGDVNAGKSLGASATYTPHAKVTLVQNILVGPEQPNTTTDVRRYLDTNLTIMPTSRLSTGVNYVLASDRLAGRPVSWNGAAVYSRLRTSSRTALAVRGEIFRDPHGMASGTSQTLREVTVTGEATSTTGLILRLEYRRDWSTVPVFVRAGVPRRDQQTMTLAVILPFSSTPSRP